MLLLLISAWFQEQNVNRTFLELDAHSTLDVVTFEISFKENFPFLYFEHTYIVCHWL